MKGLTLIELLIAISFAAIISALVFTFVASLQSDFTMEEWFLPEQSKARYQREMVEELRRANDLKEQDEHEH